nr:hypothetical protein 2 [Desulfobulbaceae bacterium]
MEPETIPWVFVKEEIAYEITPNIYRLRDRRIAVVDHSIEKCWLFLIEPTKKEKLNNEH